MLTASRATQKCKYAKMHVMYENFQELSFIESLSVLYAQSQTENRKKLDKFPTHYILGTSKLLIH